MLILARNLLNKIKNIIKMAHDKKQGYTDPEDVRRDEAEVSGAEEAVVADPVEEAEDTQAEEEVNTLENQLASAQEALEKEKKEYMFLMAEFDNFRKRTIREKSEIIRNAGENVFKGLLPVMDDFERGLKAAEGATDVASVREGMELIYQKLKKYMEQNGVKEMATNGEPFDADSHEAIASVPAPSEDVKGKVIDTVEKGYTINDKVLRHAKVVVGQ
ncbi:MAG: nucleotide exchange factor GrpE [Muribaculaceae bacterium]|nr:nucleotide exchange factor GrpE [Muribaculaceae bacterium]